MSEGGVSPNKLSFKLDHISDSNVFFNNSCFNVVENYITTEKCIQH